MKTNKNNIIIIIKEKCSKQVMKSKGFEQRIGIHKKLNENLILILILILIELKKL